MADERGYERRVATGGPAQAVLATPDAYGAGIGAAIADLGGELHQRNLRAYKAWRAEEAERESADAAVRFAALRHRGDDRARELEKTTIGGAGYAEGMAEFLDSEVPTLLDGIKEDSVRRRIEVQAAEYSQTALSRAEQFAAVRGAEHAVEQTRKSWDLSVNRIRTQRGDPATFGQEYAFQLAELRANPNISEDMRVALESQMGAMLQGEQLRSFGKGDPETVKAILASGAMDHILSPQDRADIDREADLTIRAREQEAQAQAIAAKRAAADSLDEIAARQGAGETIGVGEIRAAEARALAAGVRKADVIEWRTAREDKMVQEYLNPLNDPTGEKSMAEAARIKAKHDRGEGLTPIEGRTYDGLVAQAKSRFAEAGKALKGLSDEDLVERVQSLPPAQRHATVAGARPQGIVPDIAMLPTAAARAAALQGRATLKARPELLNNRQGENQAKEAFAAAVGGLSRTLGPNYGPKLEVAKALYADWAARTGTTVFDEASFALRVSIAMGATRRGDGQMQGGIGTINGRKVLLPDQWTEADLRSSIARTDWSQARDVRREAVGKAFITREMYPRLAYETDDQMVYHMVDRHGNALFDKDRRVLPVKVPKRATPEMLAPPKPPAPRPPSKAAEAAYSTYQMIGR